MACDDGDFDEVAMTCAAPYWREDTGFLPPLSAADGLELTAIIAGVWAAGFVFKLIGRALLNRH